MIAGANSMSKMEFCRLYFGKQYKASDISITELERITEEYASNLFPTIEDIITKHSRYQTMMPFIRQKKNILLMESVIRSTRERNLLPNPLGKGVGTAQYCPECLKEDRNRGRRPYVRVWHNLPGVSACSRHGCKLYSLIRAEETAVPASEEEIRYAAFLYQVYLHKPRVTLESTIELISETGIWEKVIRYGDNIKEVVIEFSKKFTPEEFLEQISSMEKSDCEVVIKTCPFCGHSYYTHAGAEAIGYGCPSCDSKIPDKELLQKRLDLIWNKKYELTDFQDNAFTVTCRICGTKRVVPMTHYYLSKEQLICKKCDGRFVDRTGETGTAKNGLEMKIIRFNNAKDMDVRFSDGVVVCGVAYTPFKLGNVRHPDLTPEAKTLKRIREKRMMNCGIEAEIIAYRSATDIDIRFSDGEMVAGISYYQFEDGRVLHPSLTPAGKTAERLGEMKQMNCGKTAKIIAYRGNRDIDVEFDNGEILKHVSYGQFSRGTFCPPSLNRFTKAKSRLGEKMVMKNGQEAEIVVYRTSADIDVRFPDGAIAKHADYYQFARGYIKHPSLTSKALGEARLGERRMMNCGKEAVIITYRKSIDLDVRFDDGVVVEHRTYHEYKHGKIRYPYKSNEESKKSKCSKEVPE